MPSQGMTVAWRGGPRLDACRPGVIVDGSRSDRLPAVRVPSGHSNPVTRIEEPRIAYGREPTRRHGNLFLAGKSPQRAGSSPHREALFVGSGLAVELGAAPGGQRYPLRLERAGC
jgi:hypothetical protein